MTRRGAFGLMCAFGAIIVACVAIVVARGTGTGDRDLVAPRDAAPPAAAMPAPAPPVKRDPIAALGLPSKGFDARAVIGHTRAEVVAALGKGESRDGGRIAYAISVEQDAIVIFDGGRGVGVEIPSTKLAWGLLSDQDRFAFVRWLDIDTKEGAALAVNAKPVVIGDALPGRGLSVYEAAWYDATKKRLDDEAARQAVADEAKAKREAAIEEAAAEKQRKEVAEIVAASHEARLGFVETFAAMAAHEGLRMSATIGDLDTTLVIVIDGCGGVMLMKIREIMGQHARNVGFERIECSDGQAVVEL